MNFIFQLVANPGVLDSHNWLGFPMVSMSVLKKKKKGIKATRRRPHVLDWSSSFRFRNCNGPVGGRIVSLALPCFLFRNRQRRNGCKAYWRHNILQFWRYLFISWASYQYSIRHLKSNDFDWWALKLFVLSNTLLNELCIWTVYSFLAWTEN